MYVIGCWMIMNRGIKSEMAKRGKSGELLVAGELLARGYDVFLPFVDTGIDLVAKVGKEFLQIQVKQSKLYSRRGKPTHYWKILPKKSFDANKGENVFYIFVLKRGTEMNYLIVPSLWLDANSEKFDLDKTEKYHLYFSQIEDGKISEVRKSGLDMTRFLNNWDVLEA